MNRENQNSWNSDAIPAISGEFRKYLCGDVPINYMDPNPMSYQRGLDDAKAICIRVRDNKGTTTIKDAIEQVKGEIYSAIEVQYDLQWMAEYCLGLERTVKFLMDLEKRMREDLHDGDDWSDEFTPEDVLTALPSMLTERFG